MSFFALILPTVFILFSSALIRQITGFGHALLAIPLVTLVAGIRVASPLVTLAGVVIGLVATLHHWRAVDRNALWRLVAASVIGIPLGLWLFQFASEGIAKRMLGAVLILYSSYCLLTPSLPVLRPGVATWLFGFVAGILGGAYNTSGPPIVIYGTLTRWPPEEFRATLQPYFLLTSIVAASGQFAVGLWTHEVLLLFVWALPAMLAGLLIGERLTLMISKQLFNQIIYGFLILTGALFFL